MIKEISSSQNSFVKRLTTLTQKSRNRKKEGVFVVEGIREIERALKCGYQFSEVVFNDDWTLQEIDFFQKDYAFERIKVTEDVFQKFAYRSNVKNAVGLAKMNTTVIEDVNWSTKPLIIVLETVEKPGNLGAILRSSNAAGVDAVIVCDQQMDIYNPNVIRNSLGGFFNVPVVQLSSKDAIAFLEEKNIQILTTYLEASKPYFEMDLSLPTALVFGSEAHGVSEAWIEASSHNIIIPMTGVIDSLNVSNAASIVMFEAARQRH